MSEFFTLHVNGRPREVADSWLGESLLDVLRDRLGLYGTKGACTQGECGSCSVLVDGELVCSCLVLAASAIDRPIVTIEGVGAEHTDGAEAGESPQPLTDVQRAFVDAGAVQCGFCTPGLIVAIEHLLDRDAAPDELTVREELAGNVCRCTGYGRILDAVERVVVERRLGGPA